MKIVIAPNALKGSLTAAHAAEAIKTGLLAVDPHAQCVCVPVADGGDGLVDVFIGALDARAITKSVTGPRFKRVEAEYCYASEKKLAAVEMAKASGIALLNADELDPTETTTFGTGELIADALERGAEHVIVGIGGSATTDGGIGMAAALGVRFLDAAGNELRPIGADLLKIASIDNSALLPQVRNATIEVACDVDNPLIGEHGAARVYGPQKGATPEQVELLEAGLTNLAKVMKNTYGVDVKDFPGAGAAGGLGAGLKVFLGADLRKGIDLVFDAVELEQKMSGADLVYTAEGQIDFQTKFGKAPAGVAVLAKKHNIPCIAIAGSVGEGISQLHDIGINAVFSLCSGPTSLDDAMNNGVDYIQHISEQTFRSFLAGRT